MPLRIIRNDLLKMEVDAIVNPTDRRLSGSGSIDLKIHSVGKEALKRELAAFGRCNVGDAILTHAYNLPCEYIIHTVGPIWNGDEKVFKTIESCYRHCLEIALDQDFESIAFPLIATGTFGCPTDKAIQIAINTINSFLIDYDLDVYLVVYNSEAFGISQKLVEDVKSYINADIVEDERIQRIQQLLSFYEFNDTPLAKRPVGKIRISEAIELADEGWSMPKGMPFPIETCCSLKEDSFEYLIPDLVKIKGFNEDSFTYKLFKIIDDNKLKDADVYNAAGISKMVFSNLRKGTIPRKKTVFQLCLALPLSIEQATDLLASAGYTFVLSDKFEKTIKKIIEVKNTTKLTRIDVIDLILYELGLPVFNSAS